MFKSRIQVNRNNSPLLILVSLIFISLHATSQYAPAAQKPGSTAISMDSTIFIDWASECKIQRGWRNITYKDSGFTSIGDTISATGKAGENGVVSLGDSGIAICKFRSPITNGPGWDFAVFENTFDDRFLELAFVEVSSDGWRYFRFPCHSLSDTALQCGAFGYTEPEKINNLAGKYRYGFGVPFDIDELPDYKDLNKQSITHVKIVDVVGSLNPLYSGFDTAGRKINDPWPTPWPSGGFDLDAIGVIHQLKLTSKSLMPKDLRVKGPNPISENQILNLYGPSGEITEIVILNSIGKPLKTMAFSGDKMQIMGSDLPEGIFILLIKTSKESMVYKGLKHSMSGL